MTVWLFFSLEIMYVCIHALPLKCVPLRKGIVIFRPCGAQANIHPVLQVPRASIYSESRRLRYVPGLYYRLKREGAIPMASALWEPGVSTPGTLVSQ